MNYYYWYSVKNASSADLDAATGDPHCPVGEQGVRGDYHFNNGADDFDMVAYETEYVFDGSEDYAVILLFSGQYSEVAQNHINPIYGKVNWGALTDQEAGALILPYMRRNIAFGQSWMAEVFGGALMRGSATQAWSQAGKDKFSDDLQPLVDKTYTGDIGQMERVANALAPNDNPPNDPLSQAMVDAYLAKCLEYKQKFPDGT